MSLGTVGRNKYIKFEIAIKEYNDSLTNETQYLSVLNHLDSKLEMRIGTTLVVYFTDIYLWSNLYYRNYVNNST